VNKEAEARLAEQSLTHRIGGAAYNVATQWNVDQGDVEQEMILAILEQYTLDPDFLNQTDAYIVNKAAWAVRDALRRQARQWNNETENYETFTGTPLMDLLADEVNSTDLMELQATFAKAYDELEETDRAILTSLYEGYTYREIGAMVGGLSQTSVANRIHGPIAEAIGLVL